MTPEKHEFTDTDGFLISQYRLQNGILHRENAPAFICEKGNIWFTKWFLNGRHHRYGGPVIEECKTETLEAAEKHGLFMSKFRYGMRSQAGYFIDGNDVSNIVHRWLFDHEYVWERMSDIEKWELEIFMRTLC